MRRRTCIMESRNYITFESSFSDDAEWTATGSPLVPAGRAIAQFLVAQIACLDWRCSEPEQHSFYGWSFEVDHAGATIWCLLQYAEPWLVITECRTAVIARLLRPTQREKHAQVVDAIKTAMQQDSRFSAIRLWTKTEFESRQKQPRERR